jgi:hypothetical protein
LAYAPQSSASLRAAALILSASTRPRSPAGTRAWRMRIGLGELGRGLVDLRHDRGALGVGVQVVDELAARGARLVVVALGLGVGGRQLGFSGSASPSLAPVFSGAASPIGSFSPACRTCRRTSRARAPPRPAPPWASGRDPCRPGRPCRRPRARCPARGCRSA